MSVENNDDNIYVGVTISSEDDPANLEGLERFLDYIDEVDRKYKEQEEIIQKCLIKDGILENPFDNLNLKYLTLNSEEDEIEFGTDKFKIGELTGIPTNSILVGNEGLIFDNSPTAIKKYMPLGSALKARDFPNELQKEISYYIEITSDHVSIEKYSNTEISKHEIGSKYKTGNVYINFACVVDNYELKNANKIKKFDEIIPKLIKKYKDYWQNLANNIEDNSKDQIEQLQNYFNNHTYNPGTIYINGNRFYYRSHDGTINIPADKAIELLNSVFDHKTKDGKENWEKIYKLYSKRKGTNLVGFEKGKIIPMWKDSLNPKAIDLDDAIKLYSIPD